MSNTMPSKRKKSKKNYAKMAKDLKGLVEFNIDLRKAKSKETTFTRGQKSALTKAYNEKRSFLNQTFVPIKRVSGESKKDYKKRLSQTKKDLGQTGSFYPGVFTNTPDFVNIKAKKKKNDNGKFTTELSFSSYTKDGLIKNEIYIPIGNGLDFALNPKKVLRDIRKKYKNDFPFIAPNHSGFRGNGGHLKFDDDYQRFESKLIKWANEYAPITKNRKNEKWLSGFYVADYVEADTGKRKFKKQRTNSKGRNV